MRSKSQIITFNYQQLKQDLGFTDVEMQNYLLNDLNLDYEQDGKDLKHKVYFHYDSFKRVGDEELLSFFPYVLDIENRHKGSDYMDMYTVVDEEPIDRIYKVIEDTIYMNVKFSEIKSGLYNINDLIFERDL